MPPDHIPATEGKPELRPGCPAETRRRTPIIYSSAPPQPAYPVKYILPYNPPYILCRRGSCGAAIALRSFYYSLYKMKSPFSCNGHNFPAVHFRNADVHILFTFGISKLFLGPIAKKWQKFLCFCLNLYFVIYHQKGSLNLWIYFGCIFRVSWL